MLPVLTLYYLTLVCEVITVFISILIFQKSIKPLRWAWLIIAIGLSMMAIRRIGLILNVTQLEHYDFIDAILSLPIAACLLLGALGLNKLLLTLENKQLLIETLAQFDPLTNSYSRSQILYRISEEISRSLRTKRPFSLLEFDIDHFKYVNDQFGHPVGDEVLINLVRNTKEILRTVDSVGRIGGEEFLLLMPETGSQGASELAERLRAHIESAPNQTKAQTPIKITISIGVATFYPNNPFNIERGILLNEIIRKADMVMYEAKNNGRNQVAVYRESH
jgi:diguanylate cyclase (GGDEF)-like protein